MSSITRQVGIGTFKASARTRELLAAVLDSGRISYGQFSKELEARFSDLHGCAFGVLSNSGTSSLQVALQALKETHGWQDGDEVIVPAVTFVATANIVLHNRMRPVFVDVDPRYYELDPQKIEAAITPKTRAIIPVHLFGLPCEMEEISDIAKRYGLRVIEDSCETMFVDYASRPVGAWGDIGCFSFYVAHLLTAGVGGIGITNNPDLAAKMRSLVNHGRDGIYISIDDDAIGGDRLKEVVAKRFRFESIGHSFRITELEAAVALSQLDDYKTMIASRQSNATYLTRRLREHERNGRMQLPSIRPKAGHAFMMYPIVLLNESKWALCQFLEASGIETREMLPLINQPVYQHLVRESDYPVAEWINRCGFYVGCHQDLCLKDLDHIADTIDTYFNGVQI